MNAAVAQGDMKRAKSLQETGNAIIFFSLNYAATAVIKRAMTWQGADAGYCRRPFENFVAEAEEEDLKAAFRKLKQDRNITDVEFLDMI